MQDDSNVRNDDINNTNVDTSMSIPNVDFSSTASDDDSSLDFTKTNIIIPNVNSQTGEVFASNGNPIYDVVKTDDEVAVVVGNDTSSSGDFNEPMLVGNVPEENQSMPEIVSSDVISDSVEEKGTTQVFDFVGVDDAKKEEVASEVVVEPPAMDVNIENTSTEPNLDVLTNEVSADTSSNDINLNVVSNDINASVVEAVEEKKEENVSPVTRYNPVTGEEINLDDLKKEVKTGEVSEPKRVEIEAKPKGKANTFFLVLFFIFMLGFIIFLPDLVAIIDAYKSGNGKYVMEDYPSGKLVCTLETNTVNLDKTIERVFYYEDLKLKSAKFSTVVRGDATLDEETLAELYNQCNQIKQNVQGMTGVNVTCELMSTQLTEKETFDYATYDAEKTSSAYVEAGGSLVEFQLDQDIDKVMSNMRQGGFKCTKEK